MSERLKDNTAIVTGATKGLGRGIAFVLAANGARILVVGRDEEGGAQTVASTEKAGGTASFFKADVSRAKDVEAMVQAAADRYGGIDILCSNAGIFPSARIDEMSEDDWDTVNSVNLKATFLTVKACMPYMRKRGAGRIVLTSSITGPITGYPGWSHYGPQRRGCSASCARRRSSWPRTTSPSTPSCPATS